jgi:hypothetical protein
MAEMDVKDLAAFLKDAADSGVSDWASKRLLQSAMLASGALKLSVKTNLNTRKRKKRRRSGTRGGAGLSGSFRPMFGLKEIGGSGITMKLPTGKGAEISVGAYSDLPYANIHETGEPVIRKKTKYLTIPLTPEAESLAAPEFPASLFFTPHHLRKPTMEMIGFLSRETGKPSDPIEHEYILAEWVKLPARHYITKAKEKVAPKVLRLFTSEEGPLSYFSTPKR